MIVDSHCHAWATWPYEPPVPDPSSRSIADQLIFEMDQAGVDKAVVICARIGSNPDNNEYVAAEARKHDNRIYPFPDVDSSWSPEYHTPGAAGRLAEVTGRLGARGFTHYLGRDLDGWVTSDEGMEFFAVAAERGLIASIAGGPRWQPALREVAARYPKLTIISHHLAGLRATGDNIEHDLNEVLESAALPNIMVKVSGFYYGAAAVWDFPYPESIALFERIYDAFGPRRLYWGSDFPVCLKGRCTYTQALEVVRSHCTFIPADGMEWVLGRALDEVLRTGRPAPED